MAQPLSVPERVVADVPPTVIDKEAGPDGQRNVVAPKESASGSPQNESNELEPRVAPLQGTKAPPGFLDLAASGTARLAPGGMSGCGRRSRGDNWQRSRFHWCAIVRSKTSPRLSSRRYSTGSDGPGAMPPWAQMPVLRSAR